MSNGKRILDELDFEREIKAKDNRELLEFVAREIFDSRITIDKNAKRSLENRICLTALIVLLIGLGVIDAGYVPFIGG